MSKNCPYCLPDSNTDNNNWGLSFEGWQNFKEIHEKEHKVDETKAQLERIQESIKFYLEYHKIPEPAKTMIVGNLLEVFKKEIKL